MPPKAQDITDAELAVLEQLWARAPATVRELSERLYGGSAASDLATVQKLLGRLEGKGAVARNRQTWPHQFQASIGRQDLIERRLQSTADQLCGGSLGPLLTHLVSTEKLDRQERQHLRRLLDQLGGGSSASGASSDSPDE
jgi:predicted transcriptional regulator